MQDFNENSNIDDIINQSRQLDDAYLDDERKRKLNNEKIKDINDFNLYKTNNLFNNKDLILTNNIINSKDFITHQLENLIKDVNNYKVKKDNNETYELHLANRFGVLLKNMISTPRSNWNNETSEIKLNKSIFIENKGDESDFVNIVTSFKKVMPPLDIRIIDNDFSEYIKGMNNQQVFAYLEVIIESNEKKYKIILPNESMESISYSEYAKCIISNDIGVNGRNELKQENVYSKLDEIITTNHYYNPILSKKKSEIKKNDVIEVSKSKDIKKEKVIKSLKSSKKKKTKKIEKVQFGPMDIFIKKSNDKGSEMKKNKKIELIEIDDKKNEKDGENDNDCTIIDKKVPLLEVSGYLYDFSKKIKMNKIFYIKIENNSLEIYVCYNNNGSYFIKVNPKSLKVYIN